MNIGLIAMSGVRACDEELLRIGLTLPGFVERSKAVASLPSLGLLTLAGMTPREHRVTYHAVADLRDAQTLVTDYDLVAISSFSAQIHEAYALAERFAAQRVPVVIGGLHVTSAPDEPARHGASAAVGEGELLWPQILRDARAGTLQLIYSAAGREFDLAQAPLPAYELLDHRRYNRLTVQTSRGCPWRCAFCASSILLTPRYKQKPAERVLLEIDRIRDLWKRPFIELADDNSFVNRAYWRRLLPELVGRHVRWFAETDLSIADDPLLLDLMRDAGCAELLIGFESPTAAGLDGLELKRNWKLTHLPRYRQVIDTIQSRGIRVNACFILGLDGQDATVFDDVYDFVRDTAPFDVQITLQTPFPGTPLYHRLRREGRLLYDGQWERCTLFDVNFVPTHMSVEELRTGFRELAIRLYSDSFTRYRREEFRSRHAHRAMVAM